MDENQLNILLIDDDESYLEFLQRYLELGLPNATITLYDSGTLGRPGPDFRWSDFDLLLLDYNLGGGELGTDWLHSFAGLPGFPRVLFLTSEESPKLVGRAIASGADGYLNKTKLTRELLVNTVSDMVRITPKPKPDVDSSKAVQFRGLDYLDTSDTEDTGADGTTYRFTHLIGRGGMSSVYLAERSVDGMTAVLKILDADIARDPQNVKRFAREGELLSKIDSPYVVKIYDHGFTDNYGYIAMEFFGRGDLAQQIRHGVSPADAVLYLHNVACGLEAIHNVGVIHRDLTPGNVMFRGDGSMALVDFGLSRRIGTDSSLTDTGVVMGTPYCMSPEQTQGMDADERTDIYGAGVIFYEMLTSTRPFVAANLPALLLAIQTEPVPMLPDKFAHYQPLVDRLIAKKPDDRFQTASELIAELAQYFE